MENNNDKTTKKERLTFKGQFIKNKLKEFKVILIVGLSIGLSIGILYLLAKLFVLAPIPFIIILAILSFTGVNVYIAYEETTNQEQMELGDKARVFLSTILGYIALVFILACVGGVIDDPFRALITASMN